MNCNELRVNTFSRSIFLKTDKSRPQRLYRALHFQMTVKLFNYFFTAFFLLCILNKITYTLANVPGMRMSPPLVGLSLCRGEYRSRRLTSSPPLLTGFLHVTFCSAQLTYNSAFRNNMYGRLNR